MPPDRRARLEQLASRAQGEALAPLRGALAEFDKHSTYLRSMKWVMDSNGAVFAMGAGAVGIVAAGKMLGGTALGAMALGGPIIWGIGATAGVAGFAALMYYEHSKHWYPKALAKLDAAIAEAERAAGTGTGGGNGGTTAALPPNSGSLALLGVSQQQ